MNPMSTKSNWKIRTNGGNRLSFNNVTAYEMAEKLRNVWEHSFAPNGIEATSDMGVTISVAANGTIIMNSP